MGRWLCDQRQAKRGTGGKFKLYPEREALLQKLVDEGKLMWIVKNLYGAFQSKRYVRKEDGEITLLDNEEDYEEEAKANESEGESVGAKEDKSNTTLLHLYDKDVEPIVETGGSKTATYNMVPQGMFLLYLHVSLLLNFIIFILFYFTVLIFNC